MKEIGDRMNFERSSGVLLHPTSLPSPYGIGDLGKNAYEFIDFLEKANQSIWQILPLGPTSFGDSPYQSFSTFAGNPLLISPDLLVEKGFLTPEDMEQIPSFSSEKVDYGSVIPYKKKLLDKAFHHFQKNASTEIKKEFKVFCNKNARWLADYTLFSSLKDYFIEERRHQGFSPAFLSFAEKTKEYLSENVQKDYYFGAVWSTWPQELVERRHSAIKKWSEKLSGSMEKYAFQQFEFFQQWLALKAYANEKGIKIIGDIPIFVAYDSADVWSNPKNFYIDSHGYPTVVAGVPPDYFSETGQLWGNPLYNWDFMKSNDYSWWVERIGNTLTLVDILRIDHFRGFDSYWAVPFGNPTAEKGQWRKGPGADLFHSIAKKQGDLPIIAEDLGIITEDVKKLREALAFPGMRILQFAFDGKADNLYLPHNYEPNTIVYTGTHDNDTTTGWYQNATVAEQDLCRRYMNISGEDIAWDFIRLSMASTAQIAVFPLQDLLKMDSSHRMNTPGIPSGNWQFRFTWEQVPTSVTEGLQYLSQMFYRNAPAGKEENS